MIVLLPSHLDDYLTTDPVARQLASLPVAPFTSQRWLLESPAKRMVYHRMYGDLFDPGPRLRIVDVGGGCTALTALLARHHDYTLVDLLAHDSADALAAFERDLGARFVVAADWYQASIEACDVVIANDLFPNVDQRLELFLERFLPLCRELRLLVSYHNAPRFHTVKRVDADEVMCMLAWTGRDVARALAPFADRIAGGAPAEDELALDQPSLFANGRQVAICRLRGDRALGTP